MHRWGATLLGIWLIGTGLISLLGLHFNGDRVVMAVVALVAGVLLLVRR
ncbi:MAG TPA: hypothetical protein VKA50_12325 [Gammaproteobacteria bacterium]|nr:hypothetical protein [Gammaproteobacteria bacterium]